MIFFGFGDFTEYMCGYSADTVRILCTEYGIPEVIRGLYFEYIAFTSTLNLLLHSIAVV